MAIRKNIVSKDDSIYEAWPDVAMTNSGKLIAIFTECVHHLNRDKSRLVIKESLDRGESWQEKKYFTPQSNGGFKDGEPYFNCARIGRLKNGKMYVIADKVTKNENKEATIHVWIGDEEGEKWNAPFTVPLVGIVPDKICELESGRIIISAHFLNPETNKLEQKLIYSDDYMKTWSKPIVVASDPNLNLCEVSILEHEGVLVAFLRENSCLGYDVLKTFSYDNGETWSALCPTPLDCGHRPVAGKLQDGRVMISYRYIPNGTQNVFCAFMKMEDVLKSERKGQKARIMPLDYDRNPSPDIGYTGWVQFDDGEIFVINYIKDDSDKAHIRGYKFNLDDIELPQTSSTSKNVF